MKRILSYLIIIAISLSIAVIDINAENTPSFKLEPYADARNINLASYDLRDKMDLLLTLTFDSRTVWPSRDKLPAGFDPQKIIEYGKNPGLGIRKLHSMGYTGKGVNIAYIDQPISANTHEAYKSLNLVYNKIRPDATGMDDSMHGPAVLSLLAGKEIGVAPDSRVYFFGHPAWLADQNTHAEALKKLIEINKTLPKDKKIRIVGFSDGPDPREKNIEAFKSAIAEAEANNIMVFDVSTLNMSVLSILPYKDRDDYRNYEQAQWVKGYDAKDTLYVPSSRTTAINNDFSNNKVYGYWTNGGFSWAMPYIVGIISLGLQIDPNLTKENAIRYLYASASPYKSGGIINPEGFVQLVEANKERKYAGNSDYYYVLYNSKNVDSSDLEAINLYVNALKRGNNILLKDTSTYSDAGGIYQALKANTARQKGNLKGIQIFGSSEDVPAFELKFKIQMAQGIDEAGTYKSDFFYSTFKNNVEDIKSDFSIYKAFNNGLKVSFSPEWPVTRLPLTKGEIGGFIKRYSEYALKAVNQATIPLVNFSSPIFTQKDHSDDMGYFIKERLDKEFRFLKSSQYRLYGNQQGYYPVATKVIGDYTKENLQAENRKGIMNLFINGHGQFDNIDQVIFETEKNSSEKRVSLVNVKDINQVLSDNLYTLTTWTCSNAWNLDTSNLIHEAMAYGKCVDAMSASAVISNNGVNNKASLEALKKNNFYYFQYEFFRNLAQGKSRSLCFQLAQKAYAEEILKNTSMLLEGNFQFNLNNVLVFHHLGLLECPQESIQALGTALKHIQSNPANPSQLSRTNQPGSAGQSGQSQGSTTQIAESKAGEFDNVSFDFNISCRISMESYDCKVTSLKAGKTGEYIAFSMDYESEFQRRLSVFNPPSGDIFTVVNNNGISPGKQLNVKFKVEASKLSKASDVTIKLYRQGSNEWNTVYFTTSQLSSLMN